MTCASRDRDLELALEALYQNGNHTFWEAFTQAPGLAVATLAEKPQSMGVLDPKLVGIDRRRHHARTVRLAQELLDRQS